MSYRDTDDYVLDQQSKYAAEPEDYDCEQHECRNCERTIVHVTTGSADCEELDDGPRLCDNCTDELLPDEDPI